MIPRTSIDEANKHLSMLHCRVNELDKLVTEQQNMLAAKDLELKAKVQELTAVREAEVGGLLQRLHESEQKVLIFQRKLQQKDHMIETLQHNLHTVEKIFSHKTDVQNLLQTMNEAEKNIKGVNFVMESAVHGTGPVYKIKQESHDAGFFVNGFSSGILSSPEHIMDVKSFDLGRGSEFHGKSKKIDNKEFYL